MIESQDYEQRKADWPRKSEWPRKSDWPKVMSIESKDVKKKTHKHKHKSD